MTALVFNHNEIYQFLFNGNTTQAIQIFIKKTNPEEFTPFLRNSYLSSLNFGIYNCILLKENISLHECCMENERKIQQATTTSFIDVGVDIISSYGNDIRYIIEKHANPHIKNAISYIHEHLSESLSLEEVSSIAYINSAYFSDLFKKEVGCGFCDYVQLQRVRTAQKLLVNTSLSIQEIAEYCGFRSAAYFATCFKKYNHTTPSAYRKLTASH